ncbi:MAG: hypothetical protein JRJ29_19330 [Deltaproteobacteria bacterium]|nr:hypothetical protein [Deltaproteobacteria bacterium]
MLLVPKETPSFENLNSYYLDIKRLCEHFQGAYGAGCIHFRSPSPECVIFFDQHEILHGVYQDGKKTVLGQDAFYRLIEESRNQNFAVDIYEIEGEKIYLWANTPSATELYKGLTTEFADLKELLKKMGSEGLTGFIHIVIGNGNESGILFLMNGKISGGSYSWKYPPVGGTREDTELLINRAVEAGAVLDVQYLPLEHRGGDGSPPRDQSKALSETMKTLEDLLVHMEDLLSSRNKGKMSFSHILKKKFLEKANQYPFLDPFAREFQYSSKKIRYEGDDPPEMVAKGVKEVVKEIAEESGLLAEIEELLNRVHE